MYHFSVALTYPTQFVRSLAFLEITHLAFMRQVLGLRELSQRHMHCGEVAAFQRSRVAGYRAEIEPHVRARIILRDAFPGIVHCAENESRQRIPLR
jgi:hypothetical protein